MQMYKVAICRFLALIVWLTLFYFGDNATAIGLLLLAGLSALGRE